LQLEARGIEPLVDRLAFVVEYRVWPYSRDSWAKLTFRARPTLNSFKARTHKAGLEKVASNRPGGRRLSDQRKPARIPFAQMNGSFTRWAL
jgi:hypothetical protein